MSDVLAIGNAIVDVIAHADDAFLDRQQLVKGSMQLIEADRAEELYAAMPPAFETSGGSAANTAVGVAALGGTAGFIGKVRDDQLGAVYRHDMRASGVDFDTAAAPSSHAAPTGRSLILVTPDAQRTMNTNLGIAAEIGADDVSQGVVDAATFVYVEGYLWDKGPGEDAVVRAMELAAASPTTKFAFSLSDGFCVDRHRDDFLALLDRGIDVLFANEDEICSMFRTPSFDEAIDIVRGRCELAYLTCGAKGSVVVSASETHAIPAEPIEELVDTTGAGDLYAAGALYALCRGADLETSGRLGSLAAAEVIGHVGPRPAVSLRELADAAGLP
ncbi:MAG: adenosine kinase [Actinomycetota bacterium]|nr:adenosine kinase [Acidimicrobiia bacterium]MDQ3293976.1 adenosine kinase [Actinomycetota bacterium]